MLSATRIPGAPDERQGAGVVDAGLAVAAALADNGSTPLVHTTPVVERDVVRFTLHDHDARSVAVRGSWSNWIDEARAERIARGAWEASLPLLEAGRYHYKFLLDDSAWLPDPGNPFRSVDDDGNVNSVLVVG